MRWKPVEVPVLAVVKGRQRGGRLHTTNGWAGSGWAGAIAWDGATAPIRRIDWSRGKPVPEIVD